MTYDIVGLSNIAFVATIFFFNCGAYFISENRIFLKNLALYSGQSEDLKKSSLYNEVPRLSNV